MAESLGELLRILMRWLHVASAALLVGGMFYSRFVAEDCLQAARERLRPWLWGTIAGLVASGLYNLHAATGHSRYYWMWMIIKLLLALHVFASAGLALAARTEAERRRRAGSAAVSGLVLLAIAAYLRRIY
ncbi:MAG: hypothetical protein RMI94_00185 [Bryobacterales bacterium]|nr:hypothetical protein [Bryobacteraceae bacterium]MDW8128937.1 hypothetical protein [Bryobacterales bacterium]